MFGLTAPEAWQPYEFMTRGRRVQAPSPLLQEPAALREAWILVAW